MKIIYLLLYIAAAACFGVAAFAGRSTLGAKGGGRGGNVTLLAAGLFFWSWCRCSCSSRPWTIRRSALGFWSAGVSTLATG